MIIRMWEIIMKKVISLIEKAILVSAILLTMVLTLITICSEIRSQKDPVPARNTTEQITEMDHEESYGTPSKL